MTQTLLALEMAWVLGALVCVPQKPPKCQSLYSPLLSLFVALSLPIFASLFPHFCWELESRLTKGLRSMLEVMVERLHLVTWCHWEK